MQGLGKTPQAAEKVVAAFKRKSWQPVVGGGEGDGERNDYDGTGRKRENFLQEICH
jgi:hypothetical protein